MKKHFFFIWNMLQKEQHESSEKALKMEVSDLPFKITDIKMVT